MHIKIYIKRFFKIKTIIFAVILLLIAFSLFCISFYSHKADESQSQSDCVQLPIVMYHMVLKNPGVKNRFMVSVATLEEDIKYIKQNGYSTILIKDLIEYTESKKELPPKPILLTFDDGSYNNYLYAFPLAQKYNIKFVFSPIGKEADRFTKTVDEKPEYAYANWNQISEMASSGLVEIQNHTYDMHSSKKPRIGCVQKKGESANHYKESLAKDLLKSQKLIKEKTGSEPTAFFYPFGAYSECSDEIVKSLGFKATFICESKINTIRKDPECLFKLYRFLRPPGIPAKKFFSKFEKQDFKKL